MKNKYQEVMQEFVDHLNKKYRDKQTDLVVEAELFLKTKNKIKNYNCDLYKSIEAIQFVYENLDAINEFLKKNRSGMLKTNLTYNHQSMDVLKGPPYYMPFNLKLELQYPDREFTVHSGNWLVAIDKDVVVFSDKTFREMFRCVE